MAVRFRHGQHRTGTVHGRLVRAATLWAKPRGQPLAEQLPHVMHQTPQPPLLQDAFHRGRAKPPNGCLRTVRRASSGQPFAGAWGPLRLRLTARSPGLAGLGLLAAQSPEQYEQTTRCPSASATFAISEHTHPSPSHPISAPSTRRLAPSCTSQHRYRGPRASPRRAS